MPDQQILTIEAERLFSSSAFGKRVQNEIEAESAVLAAENERIVAELSQEEQDLTDRRAAMEPAAFRALTDAFDQKVQEQRANQKAKLDALNLGLEKARSAFFDRARPILADVMRESNASVILERSNVFLSANAVDVTDLAISRINQAIGDGVGLESQPDQ